MAEETTTQPEHDDARDPRRAPEAESSPAPSSATSGDSSREHSSDRSPAHSADRSSERSGASSITGGAVTGALLATLALQNAVPPFATDMYTPAFPQVTADLSTSAAMIGLTLTAFFVGFGSGQIIGGALSDQLGRRRPMIAGGLLCLIGGVICALAPSVWVLLLGRFLQGFGGGAASAVGRAILVDCARGHLLARTMSLLQAIGGLAPMIAPLVGAFVLTHAPWRAIFWFLTAFAFVMMCAAWRWAPESLPVEHRRGGGLQKFFSGIGSVFRIRLFVGFMLTSSFSSFCMFAYISNASYVFQQQLGLSPVTFSWIFAGNALLPTLLALVNVRLIGYFQPRRLVLFGLSISALSAVIIALTTFVWNIALIPTCIGFALLMASVAFIFGNSSAMALGEAREHAGTASAVQGLVQSLANALSAPLATMGGGHTAVPMAVVMLLGVVGAWICFFAIARGHRLPPARPSLNA